MNNLEETKPDANSKASLDYYTKLFVVIREFRQKDGLWEAFLGLFLLFGLFRLAGSVLNIAFLKDTMFVTFLPIMVLSFIFYDRYQAKNLKRLLMPLDENMATNFKDYWGISHIGWDELILASLAIIIYLVKNHSDLAFTTPENKTVFLVMLGLGCFATMCVLYAVKYYIARYFIWAVLILAIVVLMGLKVITLANLALSLLPLAVAMIVFGMARHIRYVKTTK